MHTIKKIFNNDHVKSKEKTIEKQDVQNLVTRLLKQVERVNAEMVDDVKNQEKLIKKSKNEVDNYKEVNALYSKPSKNGKLNENLKSYNDLRLNSAEELLKNREYELDEMIKNKEKIDPLLNKITDTLNKYDKILQKKTINKKDMKDINNVLKNYENILEEQYFINPNDENLTMSREKILESLQNITDPKNHPLLNDPKYELNAANIQAVKSNKIENHS